MKAKVDLHIGELVLRDLPSTQRNLISAAVEHELANLIEEQGVPPAFHEGGALPSIQIDVPLTASFASPKRLGAQIAKQIYLRLAESTPRGIDSPSRSNK
jgi:hypothetical protein